VSGYRADYSRNQDSFEIGFEDPSAFIVGGYEYDGATGTWRHWRD
jgi:hypothetical protein